MTNTKVLVLLVSALLFVNYINYILPDRDTIERHILLLERKIAKEQKLNQMKIAPASLKVKAKRLFFDGKTFNYSKAMNALQRIVNNAAEKTCKITHIQWAQSPLSETWYETLQLNLSLECSPKDLFLFINTLRDQNKLLKIEDLYIAKPNKQKKLRIRTKVKAYMIKATHDKH